MRRRRGVTIWLGFSGGSRTPFRVYAWSVSASKTPEQLEQEKKTAAHAALRYVRNDMILGLGSGSTATYFLELLAEAVRRDGLTIEAVASSLAMEIKAAELGLRICAPRRGLRIDLTIDGADEIAADLNLIKGAGGALLREKIVARHSHRFFVIADSSKRVSQLGRRRVPLEVSTFAMSWVMDDVAELGGKPALRMDKRKPGQPFLTDQQNYLLDCDFGLIGDPPGLAARLKEISGLLDHGLFLGLAHAAFVADGDEVTVLRPQYPPTPLAQSHLDLD
jgi:ribose 5-phosphate isomerase A